jgi:hypothetical protein
MRADVKRRPLKLKAFFVRDAKKAFLSQMRLIVEQSGESLGKHGSAKIVPLCFVTFVNLKKFQLLLCFYALRYHPQFEASCHTDDRRNEACLVGSGGYLTDE